MFWRSQGCFAKNVSYFQSMNFVSSLPQCSFEMTVRDEGLLSGNDSEFYFWTCQFARNWDCEEACRYSAGKLNYTAWSSDNFCSFSKEVKFISRILFFFLFWPSSSSIVFRIGKMSFETLAYMKNIVWVPVIITLVSITQLTDLFC